MFRSQCSECSESVQTFSEFLAQKLVYSEFLDFVVIYSDECRVELGMDNCLLTWRRPVEEWTPLCLNPGRGARVTSLMIWDCITYIGVDTLTFVDGNINAQKYIEVIDNFVWPVIARHFPDDNICVSR